jgi:hypothetical protein
VNLEGCGMQKKGQGKRKKETPKRKLDYLFNFRKWCKRN